MANMTTCACGWTVISPLGADNVKKHVLIHLHDDHPGTSVTEDELMKMIKTL
jgi:hypothetical protein